MNTQEEKKWLNELNRLYKLAESKNESIPGELAKQIEIYAEILGIIGKFLASATYNYGKAYADRKNAYGMLLSMTEGTQRDKEGQAEVGSHQARLNEAEAEAEMVRWKHAFLSTQELIQAKKKSLEVLMVEYYGKSKVS